MAAAIATAFAQQQQQLEVAPPPAKRPRLDEALPVAGKKGWLNPEDFKKRRSEKRSARKRRQWECEQTPGQKPGAASVLAQNPSVKLGSAQVAQAQNPGPSSGSIAKTLETFPKLPIASFHSDVHSRPSKPRNSFESLQLTRYSYEASLKIRAKHLHDELRKAEAGFPRYYNRATVLARQNLHLDAVQEWRNFLETPKDWDPRTRLVEVSHVLTGTSTAPRSMPGLLQPTIVTRPTQPEATITSGAFEAEQQQQLVQPMEVDQSAVSDSAKVEVEVEQSAVHDSANNITNTVTINVDDKIAVSDSDVVIETSSRTSDTEAEELDRLRQIYMHEGMATTTTPTKATSQSGAQGHCQDGQEGQEEDDNQRRDTSIRMSLKRTRTFFIV
jgi:hypothetical protein